MTDYSLSEKDRKILEKLQDFIPQKIFDAHAHLHDLWHVPEGSNLFSDYGVADAKTFLQAQKELYGDRKVRGLLMPTPTVRLGAQRELRDPINRWMAEQLKDAPECVGAVYVMPGDTEEQIEVMLVNPQIRGFKCYHLTADCKGKTFDAAIGGYLPVSAWVVANRHHMTITLHMVKEAALADPENMAYIKTMTAKYPNAVLILAHCARGFASWTAIEKVRELKGIPNIYYDLAAICDPATMFEVIRQAGADKVLWGSDYCIDRAKARPVNCADGFTWLYRHLLPDEVDFPVASTCVESLFAFYQACLMLDATRQDVEDIFYNNAIRLYGLEP